MRLTRTMLGLVATAALIGLPAGVATTAHGDEEEALNTTHVGCYIGKSYSRSKIEPKSCTLARGRGASRKASNRFALSNLSWDSWEREVATGRGTLRDHKGRRRSVTVTLSGTGYCALTDWFSRVEIRTKNATIYTGTIRTCQM